MYGGSRAFINTQGNTANIRISGKLDFGLGKRLSVIHQELAENTQIEFDLSECHDMDSAGIALLLSFRRKFGNSGLPLKLSNCPQRLCEICQVMNLHKLFEISRKST